VKETPKKSSEFTVEIFGIFGTRLKNNCGDFQKAPRI